jgi:hypothetical protein
MREKPKAVLRKPSEAATLAFIDGGVLETSNVKRQTSDVTSIALESSAVPRARWRRTVATRADGTAKKRLTLWRPEELAARFTAQCDNEGRSMSAAIAELVKKALRR